MKATVLLFNFSDRTRALKIKRGLMPLGFRVKEIQKADYLQPIGYHAGDKTVQPVAQVYDGEELLDEMLVMAWLGSGDLDRILSAIRRQGLGRINYKAMLTPTNRHWNALMLFEEIKKEHEAMHGGSL